MVRGEPLRVGGRVGGAGGRVAGDRGGLDADWEQGTGRSAP